MSLHKIVKESVENAIKEFDEVPWPEHQWLMLIQAKGMAKKSIISSQISLLEAELKRKKGMIRSTEEPIGGSRVTVLQNVGYNQAIQQDIDYLTEQIKLIKEI